MKRILTSVCGILLTACLIYTTSVEETLSHQNSNSGFDSFFQGTVLSLNIIFLLVFLLIILAIIKDEDNNGKRKKHLL